MTTVQSIADKLGISKGTVSKALNGASDVSDELKKIVIETAIEMGYTRFLNKKNVPNKLCILVDEMSYEKRHEFGYDIVLGFRQLAEPAGYEVEIVRVDKEFQKGIKYNLYMMKNRYLGAFVIGFSLSDPWLEEFKTSKVPTVLYDNYVSGNPIISSIRIDNDEGLRFVIAHLKSLGHTRIGYLSGDLGSFVMQERMKAFFEAMSENGLEADEESAYHEYLITDCVQMHLTKLLDAKKTAIVCSHDNLAYATILKCKELGYKIPEDISIVGFDDIPIAAYTSPPMTTIRQDRVQLGKSAFNALSSLLGKVNISTLLLHAELIIRDSTGKCKS